MHTPTHRHDPRLRLPIGAWTTAAAAGHARVALLLAACALAGVAFAQGNATTDWGAFYRGTLDGATAQLDLRLREGRASIRLLLPGSGATLRGEGTASATGAVSVALHDAQGRPRGTLRATRVLAPNDDGDVVQGWWEEGGRRRPLALRRWAQQVTRSVSDGVIDASVRYPTALDPLAAPLTDVVAAQERRVLEAFVSDGRAARADRTLYHGWQLLSDVTVEGVAGPYVSLLAQRYAYTGGAHGNDRFDAIVLRAAPTGPERLRFPDLFVDASAAVARLSPLVLADLRRQQAAWVVDGSVHALGADDLALVALTPAGLSFTFPPYAMGPYVQGSFTVVVPYRAVSDLAPAGGAVATFAAAGPAEPGLPGSPDAP